MTLTKLLSTGHRNVFLRQRESLLLQDKEGSILSVESGCLWVTQEHDSRDIVLSPGMSFEIDRAGLTIVAAEEDSRFRLVEQPIVGNSAVENHVPIGLGHPAVDWLNTWAARPAKRCAPYF
jgi:Protein of unknown function (DUF2917)